MTRPLEGIRIVEVAMWAFVPAAGAMLSDLGASVTKVESPTGDPMRANRTGAGDGDHGIVVSWENYNRGKRGITLDLRQSRGVEALKKLVANADVFLTNLLPRARQAMGIDIGDLRAVNPDLIYAVGSATGRAGDEANKGGYDAVSFWARSGIASSVTPDEMDHPLHMPSGAFGDCSSATALAGGVCAAIAQRALTGKASVVDVSLLATSMWSMQRSITVATLNGAEHERIPPRDKINNPLVNTYLTSDGRVIWLCMLQSDRFWAPLCDGIGRPDLAADPRFATAEGRRVNSAACLAELETVFAARPVDEWREILARQDGQWEVVQHVGEVHRDPQVLANRYMQDVALHDGKSMKMVSVPMQFDGAPMEPRPAPRFGEDSEGVLREFGYSEDEIIDLKIAGVVF